MSSRAAAHRQFYSLLETKSPESGWHGEEHEEDGAEKKAKRASETTRSTAVCTRNNEKGKYSEENPNEQGENLLSYIANNVVGVDKTFCGPFGMRKVVYLDFVASGKALHFIEDYINSEVLPEYGNTHTTTSVTSLQTTLFRHEARDIVRNACNASEHDAVIFVGSGCTFAIHKLIHNLHVNEDTIVITGPYEHHSNMLPWMETGAQVLRIQQSADGQLDMSALEAKLKEYQGRGKQLIGAFSAASNVTGVLTDVNAVSAMLHRYGALSFWDYAACAPYVKIDMNPYVGGADQDLVYKDAVYFSVHKFVGGPSAPGVLIAKKNLFKKQDPQGCGGGTVFFVRRENHRYLQEPEVKEEGGTPAIVESIRAGLVFQLREAVGTETIRLRDERLLSKAQDAWMDCKNLVMLGPWTKQKLPIFSFLVYHPQTGRFLHHNYVATVFNDVFGIQSRGGCACAGPYAMDVLGMPEDVAKKIEEILAEDSRLDRVHLRIQREHSHSEILRPGFVRLNLPYFIDEACLEFVLEAVKLTAEHAWKLLPQYLFNPETGEWRKRSFQAFTDRKWLGHISYGSGKMKYRQPPQHVKGPLPSSYEDCIAKALDIFAHAEKIHVKLPDQSMMFKEDTRQLRWFVLPSEASDCLRSIEVEPICAKDLPFCPNSLLERLGHEPRGMTTLTGSLSTCMTCATCSYQRSMNKESSGKEDLNEQQSVFVSSSDSVKQGESEKNCVDTPSPATFSEGMMKALEDGFQDLDVGPVMTALNSVVNEVKECQTADNAVLPTSIPSHDTNVRNENNSFKVLQSSSVVGESFPAASSTETGGSTRQSDVSDVLISSTSLNKENTDEAVPFVCQLRKSGKKVSQFSKKDETVFAKDSSKMPTKAAGKKKLGIGWFSPPTSIFKPTVAAIEEYSMLKTGDKVLVCLSGGKDSLSLLHTIRQYRFYAKSKGIHFEFGAVTIDPESSTYDPSPLKPYLKELGVPYFYESQEILESAKNLPYECASICSFCSRMKRGRIYAAARREGYNVLALGQHLDDLTESFLMSFLHNGSLNTMKAHYTIKKGDLRVIRPFVYVREMDLRNFAEGNKLPIIAENCPGCFEAPKERQRSKQLLAEQEVMFPQVYSSMMRAIKPLMARGVTQDRDVAQDSSDEDEERGNDEAESERAVEKKPFVKSLPQSNVPVENEQTEEKVDDEDEYDIRDDLHI